MRRPFGPLVLFALMAVAALWTGCSSYNKTPTPPDRTNSTAAPPTTTAPAPATNTANASNTSANRAPGGAPTGIKPPMKNDK